MTHAPPTRPDPARLPVALPADRGKDGPDGPPRHEAIWFNAKTRTEPGPPSRKGNDMTLPRTNRRAVLIGLASVGPLLALPAAAQAGPSMQVYKDPDCGCCGDWIDIIEREGFQVEVHDSPHDALLRLKAQSGISEEMASCHTAQVAGYVIEGHVPPADIRRLLAERPAAVGLAVPGMPYGAPGMGPEDERETYSVHLILEDGRTEVFSHYEGS